MAKYTKAVLAVFAVYGGRFFRLKKNRGEFVYEIHPRYLLSTVDITVGRLC